MPDAFAAGRRSVDQHHRDNSPSEPKLKSPSLKSPPSTSSKSDSSYTKPLESSNNELEANHNVVYPSESLHEDAFERISLTSDHKVEEPTPEVEESRPVSAPVLPEVWVYASTPQCGSRASSHAEPVLPPGTAEIKEEEFVETRQQEEKREALEEVHEAVPELDSGFNSSATTGKGSDTSTDTVQPNMAPIEHRTETIVTPPSGTNGTIRSSASSPPGGYQRQKSSSSDAERRTRARRLQMPLMYRMYESQSEDVRGTIRGPDDDSFRPEEASKRLRNALSGGIQSDDKAIMHVLLSHTNFQRQKIVAAYEGMYNRKLANDIEEEAGGFFLDATLALLQPAHVYSARILHNSLSIRSVNRSIAVEIALTSSASQLKVIKDAYYTEYQVSMEKDLGVKVEGLFGKMLQLILLRKTDHTEDVDIELADIMIAEFSKNEHGIEEIGRNLDLFQKVFASQGLNQIRCFLERFDARMTSTNHSTETISDTSKPKDFESILRKSVNIHSEVRHMLLMYAKIAKNMQLYFAERIHEAISGARPDHSAIIRILVTRSEIDLHDICDEYKKKYSRNVVMDLQQTCSGDFLRLLNLLINPVDYPHDDVFS